MYEDEVICDLAETYHILDYKSLPLTLLATLTCGLGANSRTMKALGGIKYSELDLMIAGIFDNTQLLLWSKTEDARRSRNRPKPILDRMMPKAESTTGFTSGEDWEKARLELLKGVTNE